jgi:acyl-CoA synthetase (AMP-forming)/AMP-acid ligase II
LNAAALLARAAILHPSRPALAVGEIPVADYAAFQRQVASLAGALLYTHRLQPGDRVALTMTNRPEYLIVQFAAWHAGMCVCPMNAKLHPREAEYILGKADVRICFASAEWSVALGQIGYSAGRMTVVDVTSAEFARSCAGEAAEMADVGADAPAWLAWTGGTTGRPKGATVTHRTLVSLAVGHALLEQPSERDVVLYPGALSHGAGFWGLAYTAHGALHVIPESQGFDPAEIVSLIAHYPMTTFFAAPTMIVRLMAEPAVGSVSVDHLKTILYGGGPMYLQDTKQALEIFGPRLHQAYGLSEAPINVTALSRAMHEEAAERGDDGRLQSVGIPCVGTQVKVVDPDGRELPCGEPGEIVVRGDVVMRDYWDEPEATADTIRGGWLWTGDMGSFDADGFLTLRDRSKDMIISGGANIYPREVEEVLLRHPSVREVAVVGRPSAEWGQDVAAFIVAHPGAEIGVEELDQLCLDSIARFKRPKHYHFTGDLPKSGYGKVLKRELAARLARAEGGKQETTT